MIIEDWLLIFMALALVIVIWDVIRHRRMAKRIAEAQKMESIGRLAGGIAHDFNNMLAGISSAADFIKLKLGKKHELYRYAQIIVDSCIRASHLTHQLLLFSRSKSDTPMRIDVYAGLDETAYLLEHSVNSRVKVKIIKKAEKHEICGYPDLVHNLILNLGLNAKDAMPSGGVVTIATRNVNLSRADIRKAVLNAEPGEYLEVSVSDTGGGIPKNLRNKIFEPFFTTKGSERGTGLGLAAVYGIVRKHNGTITYESSSSGTVFHVYLPLADENCEMELYDPHPSCPLPAGIRSKIMVVDDEVVLRELLTDILKHFDAEVVSTGDSANAVELYKNTPGIDVVMLDVIMPEKSGLEVYHDLRKINPALKTVFMSGYTEDNNIQDVVATDENTLFVAKPYQISDVVDKVSKLLAKN